MKLWQNLWIGIFFTIISIPMVCHLIGIDISGQNSENRQLASVPSLPDNMEGIKEWPSQYETYLNDNIPFRDIMVRNYNSVCYNSGISPSDKVVLGKDGWCFTTRDQSIEQHLGRDVLNKEELNTFCKAIEGNADFFKSKGIPFYFFIAPSKTSIYPEYLPDYANARLQVRRNFDMITDYFLEHTKIRPLDVRENLLSFKQKLPFLYYKTDTHWNNWGAYIAYRKVLTVIKKQLKNVEILKWKNLVNEEEKKPITDLNKSLSVWNKKGENIWSTRPKQNNNLEIKILDKQETALTTRIFITKNKQGPVLLLIGDSFSTHMLQYYQHSFSKIIVTWHKLGNWDKVVLQHGKPDVVLFEVVERYLNASFQATKFPPNFSYD